ncbi:cobalamin-binding protein [Paraburkholderia susongensis]|uniref:Iron complex transport system substrate-binding protein n=1 Tax=Paraburkholderia susongensis TaxID=1515439 RepID=A0A1X7KW15_9BURK|nr:cobalamin-binding protein [Paraburkholderia susongensis]SMG45653.1 iron complex transport system substrate-binding protein [Paraburkholderia susongensis]
MSAPMQSRPSAAAGPVALGGNLHEAATRYVIPSGFGFGFGVFSSFFPRVTSRLFAAASLSLTALAAHAAITVTDDSGATVTLPAPAQRVISLAPNVTELLYAAGGGAKMVGAVSYSDYPPEAKQLPRVGDNKSLDLERIVALKPDLVVVWRHGNAERQIDRLRELHIPLFFSEPRRLDDVAVALTKLGQLLGTSPTANTAAAAYRDDIARLRARYASRPTVSVFYQVWDKPLMTLNGEHMVSDVIALCGGRNVFAGLQPLVPTVSTEAVLAANPEAIVTAAPGATPPDTTLPQLDTWRAWPGLAAVANDNLFAIDGDLITRAAPRIAQGARQLCEDLDLARSRRKTRAP